MVIKIAICGGGSAIQRHVKASLRGYLQVKDLYYEIERYKNAEDFLGSEKVYDLLYLGTVAAKDGAALDRSLRERNPWIRMIYVLQPEESIEIVGILHANDHLRKSFAKRDFFEALQRSLEYLHHEEKSKKIIFRSGVDFLCLRPETIYYMEAIENHRMRIVTKEKVHEIRYMIKKAHAETREFGFEQPHRSYVANLLHVERMTGSDIYFTNEQRIELAKKKAAAFRAAVVKYSDT